MPPEGTKGMTMAERDAKTNELQDNINKFVDAVRKEEEKGDT